MKLKSVRLKNFKNIKDSTIEFKSTVLSGIYGPNGTGKTAVVEALQILQLYFWIEKDNHAEENLMAHISKVIKLGEEVLSISVEIDDGQKEYQINLSFEKDSFDNIVVLKEEIKEKESKKNRRVYRNLVCFDNLKKSMLPELIFEKKNEEKNKIIEKILKEENINKQSLYTENTRMNSYLILILHQISENQKKENKIEICPELIDLFERVNFLRMYIYNMFIITLQDQAMFNMGNLIKINFHLDKKDEKFNAHGELPIFLDKRTNYYPEEIADIIQQIVRQINGIFKDIVSDSELLCKEEGIRVGENGVREKALNMYVIKDGEEIFIENESAGIKKIISILSALIHYIKDENILVVIDELDAHIFEYLLALILKKISEVAKGQLIFTAHNLSPLERLRKENIIVTSINEGEVSYSYLRNVTKSTNLRQKYIRSQAMWSEDNIVPLNMNESGLNLHLKKLVELN